MVAEGPAVRMFERLQQEMIVVNCQDSFCHNDSFDRVVIEKVEKDGHKDVVDLCYMDGASNVQKAVRILNKRYPILNLSSIQ